MRNLRAVLFDYLGLFLALAGLIVFFGLSTDHFFTTTTFLTIANQIPDATVLAVGMTLVLILGGIDLSVGSVLALSSAALGVCLIQWKLPLAAAVPACLGVGLLCGLLNGLVTVMWRLPSFIVTLGMLEVARGATYLITQSQTQYLAGQVDVLADTQSLGLSPVVIMALLVVVAAQFILSRSVFGRYIIAIGTNEEAVRLSGVNPKPVKVAVFALCGLLSALSGLMVAARMGSADPNVGIGNELQAIAAAVIGGTSLMGGRGSVINSFIGVLIIAVLGAGLAQIGAQDPTKRVVTGCVIVGAVVLDYYRRRLRNEES
ncbi:MAG: ABC transporter permease [Verrucomicrobiae bacterium]|nr:ABC transporter permease [Verrucomicrobiae bacterium]